MIAIQCMDVFILDDCMSDEVDGYVKGLSDISKARVSGVWAMGDARC